MTASNTWHGKGTSISGTHRIHRRVQKFERVNVVRCSLSQLPEPHEMAPGLVTVLNCQPRMLQPKLSFERTTFSMLHVCVLSHFSRVQRFVTLWTTAPQALLSKRFSREEYWSGLPGPPPGDLPNPGIEPRSLTSPALAGRFFTTSAIWEALVITCKECNQL